MPTIVNDKKKFKDWRNGIFTVIFSAMLLEDVFLPSPVHGDQSKREEASQENLAELMPDTTSFKRHAGLHGRRPACGCYDQSWKLAPSILKKYDIPKASGN